MKDKLLPIQHFVIYSSVVIVIIGFLVYLGYKKIEKKDKFDFLTFFIGKPDCSNTVINGKVSNTDALLHAFN